jgi:glycosyltransferase involved in cell wall biosynthesis
MRNGRGGALRDGMAIATGDVIVFQDADLELDPSCFPRLLEPIEIGAADVVFGSRFLQGRPNMTLLQYWGNRTVTETLNLLWRAKLTDVETCYQMFRRDVIHNLQFDRRDMSFTVELTLRLLKTGARITEVPVDYEPRTHTEGKKLYWGDGFVSLWVLVKYRILWWSHSIRGSRR